MNILPSSFFKQPTPILFLTLILREGIALALVFFAGLLTLETILPGSVSLRTNLAPLIAGIAIALFFEEALGTKIQETSMPKKRSKQSLFVFFAFLFWTLLLFGIASIGFHPAIVGIIALTSFFLFFFLLDLV